MCLGRTAMGFGRHMPGPHPAWIGWWAYLVCVLAEADGAGRVVVRAQLRAGELADGYPIDDILLGAAALRMRLGVLHAHHEAKQAGQAEAEHWDGGDGHGAGQADLDVVNHDEEDAQNEERALALARAAIVVAEHPEVSNDKPHQAEHIDQVFSPRQLVVPEDKLLLAACPQHEFAKGATLLGWWGCGRVLRVRVRESYACRWRAHDSWREPHPRARDPWS
mmetsp:Transcript_28422/g.90936  ORF Transcript_28422/g.90936 Transcript_28422/m.90936 type:complete len:221 (-) Transcript_28422:375-1037(-)